MNNKLKRPKILLIDDELELLALIREILGGEGVQVFCASSGAEGILLNEQKNPDLIILDLRMPEMDGIETLRHIRKTDGDVRVIVLTAYANDDLFNNAGDLNVSKYLNKPFDCAELIKVVTDTIGYGTRQSKNAKHWH